MSRHIWAYESQFKKGTRAYSPFEPKAKVDAVKYVVAAEADTLRRQRDELLQVLREVREWRGDKPDWLHVVVDEALAKYDAVTGVTQEDSDGSGKNHYASLV